MLGGFLSKISSVILCTVGFLPCATLSADQGTLAGTVSDFSTRLPVSGALIQVELSGSVIASTMSDASGGYSVSVSENTYDIEVSKGGYASGSVSAFPIPAGRIVTLNFGLQLPGAIAGIVADAQTSLPLQNVLIQASLAGTVVGTTSTALDGSYSISSLVAGSYVVTAVLTEYAPGVLTLAVSPGQTTQGSLTLLPDPGTIAGTVTNSTTHLGIPEATVTVVRAGSSVATAQTDPSGNYSIAGVYPGTYSVQAGKTNLNSQTIPSVTVSSNTTTTENFLLSPQVGLLTGTVRDLLTSVALSGVTVDLFSEGVIIQTTTTASDGSYAFTGRTPGSYTVRASFSSYQTQNVPSTILINQTVVQDFLLQPNPGTISGTITNSSTALPIIGATIQAFQGTTVLAETVSVSGGAYTLSGLTPGSYTVQASALHYQTALPTVIVTSDSVSTENIALHSSPGSLAGVVTDFGTAAPLPGVTIYLFKGGLFFSSTTTELDGTYRFSSLDSTASYSVQGSLLHYQTHFIPFVPINPDQTTIASFSLTPDTGTIVGMVVDAQTSSALPGVTIKALQGSTVVQTTTTLGDGSYFFTSPFVPGEYTIQASLAHYQTGSQTTTVVSDTTSTVNISLAPNSGIIAGTVTDSITAYPLSGVAITILQSGSIITTTATAPNGTYAVSLLPGTYDVRAELANYTQQTISSITVASDTTQTVNFSLAAIPGAISGIVSNATVGGATVEALQGLVVVASTTTDPSGNYTLSSIPPGVYSVRAYVLNSGVAAYPSPVTVAANTTTPDINISLPAGPGTVMGYVRNASHAAIASVTVFALQGGNNVFSTTTNSSGYYEMDVLPAGTYTIEAQKVGFETSSESTDVTASSVTEVDFTLGSSPGTISGTVSSSSTSVGIGGASVTVTKSGTIISTLLTAYDGTYTTSAILAPGSDYTVAVSAAYYTSASESGVAVLASSTTTINVPLTPDNGTIAGTITDSVSHAGIVGATVTASQGGIEKGGATTGAGGTYTISPALLPGNYVIDVSATNYQLATASATVVPDQTTTVNVSCVLDIGTLSGTITDASSGDPLAGAEVDALQGAVVVLSTSTNGSGLYSLTGLAPGTYDVRASSTNYQTATHSGATVLPGETTTVSIPLTPKPGAFAGTVTDASLSPLGGVTVSALQGAIVIESATTDASGAYLLPNLTPGSYTVRAEKSTYQTQNISATIFLNQTTTQNFNLLLNLGAITGTISDFITTLPIEGATVQAVQGITVIAATTTSAYGTYTMSGLPPGSYTVQANKVHYQAGTTSGTVTPGGTLTANIALHPNTGSIAGSVTDASMDGPVSGATVALSEGGSPVSSTTTASDGTYSLSSINPGTTYSIQVTKTHYQTSSASSITVVSDQTTTESFALTPNTGAISGTVISSQTGGGLPGAIVQAFQGSTVVQSTTTISGGAYSFLSGFVPGPYTIRVTLSHYQSSSQTTTVTSDTTSTVNFSLPPNDGTIVGTVIDSLTAYPIEGVTITILHSGSTIATTTTATNGTYTVSILPGTYDVRASYTDYTTQTTTSVPVSSDTTQTVNFALVAVAGAISGTVSNTEGMSATVDALQGIVVVASTTTDGSGNYTLSSVPPGAYTVRASLANHGVAAYPSPVTVVANTTTSGINISLPSNPGTAMGYVRDLSSTAISGATVIAVQSGAAIFSTTTDVHGFYSMNVLTPGAYSIEVYASGYGTATQGATIVAESATEVDFTLGLDPGTISGTVTSSSASTDVGNVIVSASMGGVLIQTAATAANGTYTISNLIPGSYTVSTAATAHYGASSQSGVTVAAGAATTINIALTPNNGAVSGAVTDSVSHSGIVGATVLALQGGVQKGSATTGVGGSYTISPALPPGAYTISVSATSYQTSTTVTTIVPDQTTTINVSLVADTGTIVGSITDSVTTLAIPGAAVQVLQGLTVIASTTTSPGGSYTMAGLAPSNSYTVQATSLNYQTGSTGAVVNSDATTTINIALTPNNGAIFGIATNSSTNAPLPGVTMNLSKGGVFVTSTTTAADGTYSFSSLAPASTYSVQASLTNYQTQNQASLVIASNQTTSVGFALVPSTGTISGTMTDSVSTSGLSGVTVQALQNGLVVQSTTTLANGTYTFPSGFAPGSYTVQASVSLHQTNSQSATVTSGSTSTVSLALVPTTGSIAGTVTDSITAYPISGVTITIKQGASTIATTTTAVDGSYSVSSLAAGTYTATTTYSNYNQQTSPAISVTPSTTQVVDFLLVAIPGYISGTISNLTSTYLPLIEALNGVAIVSSTVASTTGGAYMLSSLPPGTYTIRASGYNKGAVIYPSPVTVTANTTTSGINIALSSSSGTVQNVSGSDTTHGYVWDANTTGPGSQKISSPYGMFIQNGKNVRSFTGRLSSYWLGYSSLSGGTYTAVLASPGYPHIAVPVTVTAGQTVNISLTAPTYTPGIISGTITDSVTSSGIGNALVTVSQSGIPIASVSTSYDGSYATPPVLATGAGANGYTVTVAASTHYGTATSGSVTVSAGTTTTANLSQTPNNGAVGGTATNSSSGSGIVGATVRAYQGLTAMASTTSVTGGAYSMTGLSPGGYTIKVSATGYETAAVSTTIVPDQTSTASASLVADTGTVSGTITDSATSLPVQGVAVQALQGATAMAATTSTSSGLYSMGGLTVGTYTIQTNLLHYQTGSLTGVSIASDTTTTANVSLTPNSGSLVGIATDSVSNAGLSGASLSLYKAGSHLSDTTTSSSGVYSFSSLSPASTYSIQATLTGYQAKTVSSITIASDQTTMGSFTLVQNTGTISGTITDSLTSTGISGATVQALQNGVAIQTTTSTAGGSYAFSSSFAPGTYTIQTDASHYQTGSQNETVTAGSTLTVNFSLTPNGGTITGTVTDSLTADPLSGVAITIKQGASTIATTTTATNGTYTVSSLPPGTYSVQAALTNYTTQTISSITVTSDTTQTVNVALVALPGAISGTISGIGGGTATVEALQGAIVIGSTTTGGGGSYTISSVLPGAYSVRAHLSTHEVVAYPSPVSVSAGTTTSGINITISSGQGTVLGYVRNVSSVGISSATVRALQGTTEVYSTTTDVNGLYTMDVLPPGSYTIEAQGAAYGTTTQGATVSAGMTTEVDFTLGLIPGTISGTIVSSSAATGVGNAVVTVSQGGALLQTTATAHDGTYSMPNLPPGSGYSVSVAATTHYTSASQSGLTVTSGATTTVILSMTPNNGGVTGTVTDSVSHGAVVGAAVQALQGGSLIGSATTGVGGTFTISPTLPPGSYTISVSKSGYQTATTTTTVVPDQTNTVNVSFVVDTGTISGTITDFVTTLPIQSVAVQALQGLTAMASTTSNAGGSYTMAGLAPGSYTVQANMLHYQAGSTGATVTSDATTTTNVALVPNSGTFFGVVTSSATNAPLSGVGVALSQGGSPVTSTTTAADGSYSFSSLSPASNYSIQASLTHYQTQNASSLSISSDQTTKTNFSLLPSTGTISGTVTDSIASNVLSGVVILALQNGAVAQATTTIGAGTYSFAAAFAPGTYTIQATFAHYQTNLQTVTVTSDTASTANVSLVPNGGTVAGMIKDSLTALPIGNVYIQLLQGGSTTASVYTATDGSYTISSVAPGKYDVSATNASYRSQTIGSIAVCSDTTQCKNFFMVPISGSISGVLTSPNFTSLSQIVDAVRGDATVASVSVHSTGTTAAWTIPSLPPGTYTLGTYTDARAGYVYPSNVTVTANTATTNVNFSSNTNTSGGTQGNIYGVAGWNLPEAPRRYYQSGQYTVLGMCELSGWYGAQYCFQNVAWTIVCPVPGYQLGVMTGATPICCSHNVTLTGSPGIIAGTVTDSVTSAGVSNALVVITAPQYPGATSLYNAGSFITAFDGSYTSGPILAGATGYTITVSQSTHYGTATQANVTVTAGATATINLTQAPNNGTISGTVKDSVSGSGIVGASIAALRGGVTGGTATSVTGGAYTIAPTLTGGAYTINASAAGYQKASVAAGAVPDGTTTVNILLVADPGTVYGTISDFITSSALQGVTVQALSGGTAVATATTTSGGLYTFGGLAPGAYTIQAVAPHYSTGTAGATATSDSAVTVNVSLHPDSGTLSGIITNSVSNAALTGTTVALYKGGSLVTSTTTSSNGAYSFSSLDPAATYTIQASKSLYQTQSSSSITVSSDQMASASLALVPTTGTISGTVQNSQTSSGIVGATVQALQNGVTVQTATTVAGGAYTFSSAFSPNTYTVQASVSHYQTGSQSATVTSGAALSANFSLAPNDGAIAGTVNDSLTAYPISGATVTILQGGSTITSTTTATNGTYSVATLLPGTYDVRVAYTNYTQQTTSSITVTSDTTQTVNFSLVALPGAISGTVTVGAEVEALQGVVVIASTTADALGAYTLSSLLPGTYSVRAHISESPVASYPTPVTVVANTTTSGINFSASAALGVVYGYVRNSFSVGIPSATVQALQGSTNVFSTTTDASGFYEMSVLSSGSYTIEAQKVGYQTGTQGVTVTGGSITEEDFVLGSNPGTISGTVVNSTTSAGIGDALVSVSKNGVLITTVATAFNGTYTTSAVLAPGSDYTVSVSAAHYASASQSSVAVTGGGTTTVNLSPTPNTGTVFGTITDSVSHSGITGATVLALQGGIQVGSATSGVTGAYTISPSLFLETTPSAPRRRATRRQKRRRPWCRTET